MQTDYPLRVSSPEGPANVQAFNHQSLATLAAEPLLACSSVGAAVDFCSASVTAPLFGDSPGRKQQLSIALSFEQF